MVGMARTAHEVARDTGIRLRDADSELLLGLRHGLADGAAHQFDILDPARIDSLDGLRDDTRTSSRPSGVFSPTATTTDEQPKSTATV